MKVLIVTDGFLPAKKYGGPPVSINNICTVLKEEIKCFILTSNHELGEKNNLNGIKNDEWNIRDNCKVFYYSGSLLNYNIYIEIINEIKPDLIYLNSLFSSYTLPCLIAAKKKGCKVLLAPRGELCKGAFKKKYKKKPYLYFLKVFNLSKNIFFQSTSEEESLSIEKYFSTSSDRIISLSNIPIIIKSNNIYKNKDQGKLKLIFFSRIVKKKNLLFAINILKNVKADVIFDVYGPKEDEQYWLECKKCINELPSNITVNYCGLLEHSVIDTKLKDYDAFFFPTLSENFGHVIIESLACGCPVILSKDTTPWNDIDNYCGFIAPLDDEMKFLKVLNELSSMDGDEISSLKKNAISYYEKKNNLDVLKEEYLEKLEYICNYSKGKLYKNE